MDKFCIFCGRNPASKNREHVIPDWLIRLTGNPKRIANFGIDWNQSPPRKRQFAFDEFTFPACQECNEAFGRLEAEAKTILEEILGERTVSAHQFSVLLDWLDKVRIGLWLGFMYLDRNPVGITPKYHIQTRMRQADRSIIIIRINDPHPRINFYGPMSPCFQSSPTCFALVVNGWCMVNLSGLSINSRRLGFPYAQPIHLREDGQMEVSIRPGNRRIMRPVQRDVSFAKATILQQPIFSGGLMDARVQAWFREEWVRRRSLDPGNGVGSIFMETQDRVSLYPATESRAWIPEAAWSLTEVHRRVVPFVFSRMIRDLETAANLGGRPLRRGLLRQIADFRRINNLMLTTIG